MSSFTPGEPGAPSDYTTIVDVLNELAAEGYTETFWVIDEGYLRCGACRHTGETGEMHLVDLRRFEGASDPDDEAAILVLVCPECGARGTSVVKYPPGASDAELAVLAAVEDHRREPPPAGSSWE
jgi:hypothetical protein